MSEKHTPGPWTVEDYGVGMGGLAVVAADVTFDVICWPHPDNARLIAAAPEMLEALKAFVAHYPKGINPYLDDAYGDAFDAIRKAEGQS